MKRQQKNIDELLQHIADSTHSPQGRYSALNTWQHLSSSLGIVSRIIPFYRRRSFLAAVAACLLLLIIPAAVFLLNGDAASRNENMMAFESQDCFTSMYLPDSTLVILNKNTRITYPRQFASDRRYVGIQGEAYFEVYHDGRRPFIVHSQDMDVEVLGTHFEVRAYAEDSLTRTSLYEGSVKVSSQDGSIRLEPGQSASYSAAQGKLSMTAFSSHPLNWDDGMMVFDNIPLKAIFTQLSYRYARTITCDTSIDQSYCITAKFRTTESLDEILQNLSDVADLQIIRTEKTINILPKDK